MCHLVTNWYIKLNLFSPPYRALNDLLNHVKDGHTDKIPDIMEQILVASGELIASFDSGEMVRQARILAQSTAELIQAIKGEAETQSDSELQASI